MTPERRPPVRGGDTAPDFELPAVNRDGIVSLAAYRGRSPVLIGLFRVDSRVHDLEVPEAAGENKEDCEREKAEPLKPQSGLSQVVY